MRWPTRPGVHVDRAACAWLIRRFVDLDAEFIFAADPGAVPAGITPFDMRGAALGHHQGRCSFETALTAFDLTTDPALEEIGRIVHEADLADERYDAPAGPGPGRPDPRPDPDQRLRPRHPGHHRPAVRRPVRAHPPRAHDRPPACISRRAPPPRPQAISVRSRPPRRAPAAWPRPRAQLCARGLRWFAGRSGAGSRLR